MTMSILTLGCAAGNWTKTGIHLLRNSVRRYMEHTWISYLELVVTRYLSETGLMSRLERKKEES
jgi:hypothetical protein